MPDVQNKLVFREIPVVRDAAAVTVKTIKAKLLDQIPFVKSNAVPPTFQLIGVYRGSLVVLRNAENGHLFKMAYSDWADFNIPPGTKGEQCTTVRNVIYQNLQAYPQLFED